MFWHIMTLRFYLHIYKGFDSFNKTKNFLSVYYSAIFRGPRLINQGAEAPLLNDKPAAHGKIAAMATKNETPHRL